MARGPLSGAPEELVGGPHEQASRRLRSAELHLEDCLTFPTVIIGLEGTSMAAPHVSGAAALLVPIVGRSPARIKARLQQSADNVAGNGTSPFYGKGRLNIGRAVGAIP